MVTVQALVGIAGVGGMVTAVTGFTLHNILQRRVRDSTVYKEALKIVNSYQPAVLLLGKPVKASPVEVGNRNNVLSLRRASLELPVQGPFNKGVLYVWADRLCADDQWNLYRLELEILDSAGDSEPKKVFTAPQTKISPCLQQPYLNHDFNSHLNHKKT